MPPLTRLQRRMRPLPSWNTHSTFSDSDDDSVSSPSKQSSVGFGCIEIREYSRELGVHDDIRNSLSLGWEYKQKEPIPVDEYHLPSTGSSSDLSESSSSSKQRRLSLLKKMSSKEGSSSSLTSASSSCGGEGKNNNKKAPIMPMTTKQRRKILSEFGYSKHEILNQQEDRPREVGYGGCSSNELPGVLKLVLKLC